MTFLQKLRCAGVCGLLTLSASLPVQAAEAGPAPAVGTESGLDQEIGSLAAGIKATPDDAILRARLGHLLLKKGALNEAKRSFDEALKLNPRSHAAMTGAGIVLARQGKLREAEQVLRDALVENPNPVRTHYELGLVCEKLGKLDEAIAEYKAALTKYRQGRK